MVCLGLVYIRIAWQHCKDNEAAIFNASIGGLVRHIFFHRLDASHGLSLWKWGTYHWKPNIISRVTGQRTSRQVIISSATESWMSMIQIPPLPKLARNGLRLSGEILTQRPVMHINQKTQMRLVLAGVIWATLTRRFGRRVSCRKTIGWNG